MPPDNSHILGSLQGSIDALRNDFKQMGERALGNFQNAVQGLLTRDTDLCNRTIADDETVDLLEKQIDLEGVELIIKFSPMGRDLRRVISTMKAATAVERISDHAVSLAKRAKNLNKHTKVEETMEIAKLSELAIAQLSDALNAFTEGNLESAVAIKGRDEEIDIIYRKFNEHLVKRMQEDISYIPDYVDLMFSARFIERIGDQSVNISEDAIYLLTAKDVRHGGAG